MLVDPDIIHCAAFVGDPMGAGFTASGTCFFLGIEEENLRFTYVVSARHVVRPFLDDRKEIPNPNSIWVRTQRRGKPPKSIETKCSDWICHPDRFIDICVHEFDAAKWNPDGDLQFNALLLPDIAMTPEIETKYGFGLGRDVFYPSLFTGRVGERQNIPIVRVGSVAALAIEPVDRGSPRRPAYLIETTSLGGTSGAPVFFHIDPAMLLHTHGELSYVDERGRRVAPFFLMGMLVGRHSGRYAEDFAKGEETVIPGDAEFNSGISVVLTLNQIEEVLNREELRKARAASIEARKKISGYRPSDSQE